MTAKTLNAQISAEASEWLIEFRSGDIDARGRKEFYEWLKTSPEHMRAYLELAAIWNEGHALDASRAFDDAGLLRDLQSETNITPFQTKALRSRFADAPTLALSTRVRKSRLMSLAASLILACSSLGVWYVSARDTYATSIGEERAITLSDGSIVELNSSSRVRVNFSKGLRAVSLLEGQALFHVAKDHNRPFIVHTDNAQIRAVGTQFDVYQNHAATTVTVVEGTVAVLPPEGDASLATGASSEVSTLAPISARSPAPNPLMLSAGDQVTVAPKTRPKAIQADVATATAWTQHKLIFKGTPLEDVVAEFNRYNKRRLTIRDSSVANLKVTGIFSSTDPAPLLRFLESRPDIAVTDQGNEILLSQKP